MKQIQKWKYIFLILLLFFIFFVCYSADYPDNVKQEICSKKIEGSSAWGIQMADNSQISVGDIYTPMVGDLDGDGMPEIVTVKSNWENHDNGRIAVFSGNDLSKDTVFALNADVSYWSGASYGLIRLEDEANPGDTIGLIVVIEQKKQSSSYTYRSVLKSYKYNSLSSITELSSYSSSIVSTKSSLLRGPVAFADFNNDGKPEVYVGNKVFDVYSLNLIAEGSSNSGMGYFSSNNISVSYAADVLPNVPGTELICGSEIYSVDFTNNTLNLEKTITPPSGFVSDGHTEVADFDGDGELDVLVKQYSATLGLYAYNPRTGAILFSKQIRTGANCQGFPLIGDIDADSIPEVVILSATSSQTNSYMKAYKFDGTSLSEFWSLKVEDPSGSTGITLFDFNQDGLKEIVYRDTEKLRVINGSLKSHLTGADTTEVYNLFSTSVYSGTVAEFPVVADCDADGEAEIIVTGSLTSSGTDLLLMFESSATTTWAPARKVWNQYAYNVTNVNDDLTIPDTLFNNATFFPNGLQPFNNFQEQATTINENGDMFVEVYPDTTRIDTTIFKGQSVLIGSTLYTEAVVDTLFLTNVDGCDSLVCFRVALDFIITEISDTICEGDSSVFKGEKIFQTGIYRDTISLSSGADSVVILDFTVLPIVVNNISESICEKDSFYFKSMNIGVAGEYRDTLVSALGCDSVVVLDLTVVSAVENNITESICEGDGYSFKYMNILTAGEYRDTLVSTLGCDSIIILYLSVNSKYEYNSSETINDGDSYDFQGDLLYDEGDYQKIYQTVDGCDSVFYLSLKVLGIDTVELDEEYVELGIPQMFTPNGDGLNEVFKINGLENYPQNKIIIVNRWGSKVFEASPYLNDWDGKSHFGANVGDGLLPVGTYFYILDLGDGSSARKGYIYLNY